MKSKAFPSMLALLLLGFVAPQIARAQAASGTYKFAFDDGYQKYVEFDAQTLADGSATGSVFISDEATIVYRDVDGTGAPTAKYAGFYFKAEVDGLTVNKNQSVISGTIRDASIRDLIGKRVLLTVEDNGDNTREPDQLTWGVYNQPAKDWKPSDAELKEDPGAGLTWYATDAEVKEDREIKMPADESITTLIYPISAYNFITVKDAAGDIVIRY
jgi:hypothetical protein